MLDVIDLSRDKHGKLDKDESGRLRTVSVNGAEFPAGYKRRNAYVSEFYFEKVILPNLVKGDVSLGWNRFYEYADPQKVCWIKIIPDFKSNPIKNTDKAFISRFKASRNHRFFILDVDKQTEFILHELTQNNTGQQVWRKASRMGNNALRLIDTARMAGAFAQIQPDIEQPEVASELGFCCKWLQKESTEDIFLLLCNRLLVNFGLYGACDIDAVEVRDTGKIIIHEFKRKYPFKQTAFHFVDPTHTNLEFRQSLQTQIDNMLIEADLFDVSGNRKRLTSSKEKAYGLIDQYITKQPFQAFYMDRYPSGCFGIDTSHCDTIEICFEEGFEYFHSIWWSEKGQDIDDLLNNSREARGTPNIYSGTISQTSLEGFTRTVGDDSGTFNHSTRIQYVFSPSALTKANKT